MSILSKLFSTTTCPYFLLGLDWYETNSADDVQQVIADMLHQYNPETYPQFLRYYIAVRAAERTFSDPTYQHPTECYCIRDRKARAQDVAEALPEWLSILNLGGESDGADFDNNTSDGHHGDGEIAADNDVCRRDERVLKRTCIGNQENWRPNKKRKQIDEDDVPNLPELDFLFANTPEENSTLELKCVGLRGLKTLTGTACPVLSQSKPSRRRLGQRNTR